jgi:hypothetical protein
VGATGVSHWLAKARKNVDGFTASSAVYFIGGEATGSWTKRIAICQKS